VTVSRRPDTAEKPVILTLKAGDDKTGSEQTPVASKKPRPTVSGSHVTALNSL
jgi:hypothetical protein